MTHWLLTAGVLDALNWLAVFVWFRWLRPTSSHARRIAAGDPNPWQLLRWMDISGPSADYNKEKELYLRRLYVLRTPWFGVMLHWIKREDWDRDALHDHPWPFWRFIVSGGYTETVAFEDFGEWDRETNQITGLLPSEDLTHGRFSFSKFPDGAFHRITSVKPHTVSLVFNGKKSNSWGFFVPGTGKVYWKDYINGAR